MRHNPGCLGQNSTQTLKRMTCLYLLRREDECQSPRARRNAFPSLLKVRLSYSACIVVCSCKKDLLVDTNSRRSTVKAEKKPSLDTHPSFDGPFGCLLKDEEDSQGDDEGETSGELSGYLVHSFTPFIWLLITHLSDKEEKETTSQYGTSALLDLLKLPVEYDTRFRLCPALPPTPSSSTSKPQTNTKRKSTLTYSPKRRSSPPSVKVKVEVKEEEEEEGSSTQPDDSGSSTEDDSSDDDEDVNSSVKPRLPIRDDQIARGPFKLERPEASILPPLKKGDEHSVVKHINKYLRDYQRDGVKFFYDRYCQGRGGILGDDMGLGMYAWTPLLCSLCKID